jgi:hypothetical protein
VLFESFFARTVQSRWRKRAKASDWIDRLDLSERLQGDGPPIRPILAASDRLFRRPVQLASYARVPRARVKGCSGGHITGAIRMDVLVRHLLGALDEVLWTPAATPVTARAAVPVATLSS